MNCARCQTPAPFIDPTTRPSPIGKQEVANVTTDLAAAQPVLPAPQEEMVIDLVNALRLAESANPNIAIGRQAIQEALARQLGARALLLPSLRAGMNYHLHNGNLQNSFGRMQHVDARSFYFGGGARALAAETVAFPMVQLFSHLGDAIFEPLAARQLVVVRRFDSQTIANDVLLDVAAAYLDLVAAEADLRALQQSENEMNQLVQTTASFAKRGQGREGDFQRARAEALLLHREEEAAEERVGIAAAALARLLHLDPSVRLKSPAGAIGMVQLVDPSHGVPQLIRLAAAARPELAALGAEIVRKERQVQQERTRPLFPVLSVGFSAGSFGGGTNRADLIPVPARAPFGNFGPRTDFDVFAFWQLQNMGAGNIALANQRRAERDLATLERNRTFSQIRREVAEAYALAQTRLRQVEISQHRLETAEQGFAEDFRRIRGGIGLPIEVLNSMDLLVRARQELIAATFAYDRAQFQLFVAIGQSPLAAPLESK